VRFESTEKVMYSFHKIKATAAMLIVGFLLAVAFTATAQAGSGTRQGLTAQQLKAVQARAQATDRYYHLGRYSPAAVALQAEKARATATDQYYHLGSYAVIEASSPFQWSAAGIGAAATLGVILVAGGLAVAVRRRGKTSLAGAS
jgi:hypothetical protein